MVHEHRRRYLVIHVLSPKNIGKGLLIKLTRDRTRELSEEEFEAVKPWLVYYENGWAIVRTGHLGTRKLTEIFKGLDGAKLKEGELKLRIVGTSGTIKGAFLKLIPEKARVGKTYREGQNA